MKIRITYRDFALDYSAIESVWHTQELTVTEVRANTSTIALRFENGEWRSLHYSQLREFTITEK